MVAVHLQLRGLCVMMGDRDRLEEFLELVLAQCALVLPQSRVQEMKRMCHQVASDLFQVGSRLSQVCV